MTNKSQVNQSQINSNANSPGVIILQWLTYALWGWTAVFTSTLFADVISYFLSNSINGAFSVSALASTIVILPIAITCDYFYSKHEPIKKTGIGSIILIIHAVLFLLACIGGLTFLVGSLVNLLITAGDTTPLIMTIYSSSVVAVLFFVVFLRTIYPRNIKHFKEIFTAFIVVSTLAIIISSFIGPVTGAIATRYDRLVDDNLYTVQAAIDDYTDTNNRLPVSLDELVLEGDAKKIIKDNLVEYKPNTKAQKEISQGDSTSTTRYYYQLCIDYKKPSQNYSNSDNLFAPALYDENDGYSSFASTSNHPEGYYCYNLFTSESYALKFDSVN